MNNNLLRNVKIGMTSLLVVLFLSLSSLAGAATLDQVIDGMQKRYEQTKDLTAHFTQKAYNASMKQNQVAQGTVYIKQPGMMRWDYNPPDEQMFLMSNKKFWWYTPQNNQVIVKSVENAFDSKLPLAFMSGVGDLRHDFNIKFDAPPESSPKSYTLQLIPKQPQVSLKRMLLVIAADTFVIEQAAIYDFYNNSTTLDFSKPKFNQGLDAKLFEFTPPAGTHVVQ